MVNLGNSLKSEDNLLRRFEEIHDFIYANDGLTPQQTLNEFLKVLFIKIFDENNKRECFYVTSDELKNGGAFIERITSLFEETKKEYIDIFDSDEKIKLSVSCLSFVVNKLQNISLSDSSYDSKGLAFQKFISHKEKEGKGQFFTPEQVVDLCVKIIDPKSHETIIDPCGGSGGFTYAAYKHMLSNDVNADKKELISHHIFGIDINKEISKIAKMKFLLECNVKSNIYCHNSLDDIDNIKLVLSERNENIKDGFDIVLTNPPFGSAGKIIDSQVLSRFDLGYKWSFVGHTFQKSKKIMNGQPTEILFVERCLDLLKEGGRMGIVLPNGHFENPSLDYLRDYIKRRSKILGVVNLPTETFIPFGTGVKTSLLFLEKNSNIKDTVYHIFFGKVKNIGYQGNKNGTVIYKKDSQGSIVCNSDGKFVVDEDLSIVESDFKYFKKNGNILTDNSFCIENTKLIDRLDYNFYSPSNQALLKKLESQSMRLGDLVEIVNVKSPKLKDKLSEVEYVELSDVNTHSFEIINSTTCAVHELPSRASYELRENDIITAMAGSSVGTRKHATALVSSIYDGAICTNGFRILRNPKINLYYLLYYLHSDLFLNQMMMYRTGAAIPSVSESDLQNVLIYIPDEDTINNIGQQMEKSFRLRQESSAIIENLNL